jgi:hypothetical protein
MNPPDIAYPPPLSGANCRRRQVVPPLYGKYLYFVNGKFLRFTLVCKRNTQNDDQSRFQAESGRVSAI